MRQGFGRDFDQRMGHIFGRLVGEACEHHLVQLIGLFLDRRYDGGMTMAMGDDPPGRNRVQDFLALVRP